MSTAWAKGSTRAWRQLRLAVLTRDGFACQVPVAPSGWFAASTPWVICAAPATTCGHIVAKVHGGQDVATNLRAECARHNYGDGGRLAHAARAVVRRWAW